MTDTAAPAASTARGRNPLAFLEAEIEDLRARACSAGCAWSSPSRRADA